MHLMDNLSLKLRECEMMTFKALLLICEFESESWSKVRESLTKKSQELLGIMLKSYTESALNQTVKKLWAFNKAISLVEDFH
jgi:hypothetical protein